MTRTRATGAALVLAALLAACGGSKGGDAGTASGSTVAGKAGSKDSGLPPWDENRKMNDMSGYSTPFAKAMGYDPASQDQAAAQAKFREREQKRQEGIAECMRAQGFTYTPYVPDNAVQFGGLPAAYELTRKEFVAKYGFGISTMTDQMNAPPPENMPKPEDDPNYVFQQSLSESDLQAYNKALYGDQAMEEPNPDDGSGDGSTATTAMEYTPQGCQAAGEKAASGGEVSDADKTFMEEFNTKVNALFEKVQADRRVVEANRAYATCMAGKGFPEIDKQQTAYEKVSEKMNPLWEAQNGGEPGGDGNGGATAATIASGPAEGDGGAGFTPPTFDPVKLKEVNTYEIGVATADLACGKDVMKVQYEVQLELEQAFVDANGADLARYKDLSDRGVGFGA